ncbi:MAG: thermonuclease family protein [Chthoniobacterales bacterium]
MKKIIFYALSILLFALPVHAEWETLEGCRLLPNKYNDGDSFHIKHNGKEYIFRLCYVDAAETDNSFKLRTSDQAKYWKIYKKELYILGEYAKQRSEKLLKEPFTVKTDWTDARGNSQLPRYFAVIETEYGDLGEILVKEGLVRIYGYTPRYPGGLSSKSYVERLRDFEEVAKEKKVGAWLGKKNITMPALLEAAPEIQTKKSDALFKSYAERMKEGQRR